MSKKKSFVLRLNSEMYDALEKWAADEFRSTNGQLEYLISDALKKAGRLTKRQIESGEEEAPSGDIGPSPSDI